MHDLPQIEQNYQDYIQNLVHWNPDGVVPVDLKVLQQFDLLQLTEPEAEEKESSMTRYFHVVESEEKITLINERFVIWIVPDTGESRPTTYTLIALNEGDKLALELVFSTTGIYNNSKLVLRILEKYLKDIQENEEVMSGLGLAS